MPNWFTLPKDLSRADVTVRMSYYIDPCGSSANKSDLGCATFELWDLRAYLHGMKQAVIPENGNQYFGLLDMNGENPKMSWEIYFPKKVAEVDADIREQRNVGGSPCFVTVDANGITEVIEHKHLGDVFYIDDGSGEATYINKSPAGPIPKGADNQK